jgi:DNA-binding transcriptional regulator YdaS (Cro superfamily)
MTDMTRFKQWLAPRGRAASLAKSLGITQSTVTGWLLRGRVPPKRIADVQRITKLPKKALNADVRK